MFAMFWGLGKNAVLNRETTATTTGGTTTATTTGGTTTATTTGGTTTGATTGSTTGGTLSATQSSLTANPPTGTVADGNAASVITVVLRDSLGNAIPSYAVSLSATDTTVPAFSVATITGANGMVTVPLTSHFAGPKTVTARAASFVLTTPVTFVSQAAANPPSLA